MKFRMYVYFFLFSFSLSAFPDLPIMKTPESPSNPNVITILQRDFPQFYNLIEKAGMVATLRDMNPVTIFAPVWYAFRKISPDTLASIAEDINSAKKLVGMHIMQGRIAAAELGTISTAPTLTTVIYIENDGSNTLFIRTGQHTKSKIINADVPASNGIIHVIDALIMPEVGRSIARQHEKN